MKRIARSFLLGVLGFAIGYYLGSPLAAFFWTLAILLVVNWWWPLRWPDEH